MRVCILSLCYPEKEKRKQKKRRTELFEDFGEEYDLRGPLWTRRGGEDTLVHMKVFFGVMHCTTEKERKKGRLFMFWRGTRFIRLRGKSTKRQFIGSKRERDIKCKRPTRAGRNGGKKRREKKNGGISRIAAKNHKLLCCGKHRSCWCSWNETQPDHLI